MYCRHCGNEINDGADCCMKCGFKNGDGADYCPNCGAKVDPQASVCVKCGHSLKKKNEANEGSKSKLTAGLLGIFLGSFGVHNFYLGYTGKAIAQILLSCTLVSSIWGLIEGILILTGKIDKDAKGNPLKD